MSAAAMRKNMLPGYAFPAAASEAGVSRDEPRHFKTRTSIEKNLENMWIKSQELGWNYQDFVSQVLEIMVVLNHRDRLIKREAIPEVVARRPMVSAPEKALV
ncbi:hypothetical protein JDN40_09770 [Rhodomicrobium vannielii ATCC 17100]|uniref:hypothetical protein n=1 Tax=Rhodomicrobium vannielii TaxID=1069 RepID=UPI001917AECD|nr:hypothetical protein [Rhodomicrobium vannielii]MBJ7534389.1 hypothetical protein [Rhodomicrobium vannielii ATCC 17100]